MRCIYMLWRRVATTNRLGIVILCVFAINALLVVLHQINIRERCVREHDVTNKDYYDVMRQTRDVEYVNATEEFDWKREVNAIAETVPVLESNDESSNSLPGEARTPNFPTSEIQMPIDTSLSMHNIQRVLMQNYNPQRLDNALNDVTKAYNDEVILSCENIDYLEQRKVSPRIVYNYKSAGQRKGELYLHDGQTINIVMKLFNNGETFEPEAYREFENGKEILFKLLRMQRWPGIPRLYAVCILTADGKDLMTSFGENTNVKSIRYIMDRYDDAFVLCNSDHVSDECLQLKRLRTHVNTYSQPGVAAISIMRGFAETFETLWLNGVFPYKFRPNQLVITEDFEVVFKTVESFMFFEQTEKEYQSRRLLSGTSCNSWKHCPIPHRERDEILFRIGQHCKEVKGHCGSDNRCWGLDGNVYLCALSKWIFENLEFFIPISWPRRNELEKLLICATQAIPEYRCDWSAVLHSLDTLLDQLIETLGV